MRYVLGAGCTLGVLLGVLWALGGLGMTEATYADINYAFALLTGRSTEALLSTTPLTLAVLGWYDVRDFGDLDVADATSVLQDAMDAAYADAQSGIFIPPWPTAIKISQLKIKKGMSIIGGGLQQTRLAQLADVNLSMIVNDPVTLPPTEYMHWSIIRGLKLEQVTVGGNTSGHGIEIGCRTGEGFTIQSCTTIDMPQSGYRFGRGGVPLYLQDIHGFRSGEYLLDLERTGADTWQMVQVTALSGDDNTLALCRIKTGGASNESWNFLGVKSESRVVGKQPNVFILDGLNGAHAYIHHLSALISGANTPNAIVKIVNAGARVVITGARGTTPWPYMVEDEIRPGTVAHDIHRYELAWSTANGIERELIL